VSPSGLTATAEPATSAGSAKLRACGSAFRSSRTSSGCRHCARLSARLNLMSSTGSSRSPGWVRRRHTRGWGTPSLSGLPRAGMAAARMTASRLHRRQGRPITSNLPRCRPVITREPSQIPRTILIGDRNFDHGLGTGAERPGPSCAHAGGRHPAVFDPGLPTGNVPARSLGLQHCCWPRTLLPTDGKGTPRSSRRAAGRHDVRPRATPEQDESVRMAGCGGGAGARGPLKISTASAHGPPDVP
jgi:hypothetical protein